jgi:negative regulator of genetic competence, sporulation and motility
MSARTYVTAILVTKHHEAYSYTVCYEVDFESLDDVKAQAKHKVFNYAKNELAYVDGGYRIIFHIDVIPEVKPQVTEVHTTIPPLPDLPEIQSRVQA